MTLTLTVLRCPPTVAPEMRQVAGGEFSIGRGPENDWVLPDPDKHLSKRHCVIAFRRGGWQVAGTSTNGTFVNRDEEPLESRPPRPLENGDRLRLGSYEIEVRLVEEARGDWARAGFGSAAAGPFADPFGDDPFGPGPGASSPASPIEPGAGFGAFGAKLPDVFDPLAPDEEDAFAGPSLADHSDAVSDAVRLPQPGGALPDDWDLEASLRTPAPPGAPPPAGRPATPVSRPPAAPAPIAAAPVPERGHPAAKPDLLSAFLRGAGVEDANPSDPVETMEQLGAAFRAVVAGIRRTLIARSEVKREFRIEATEIRPRGNNLLKFSANDDDALTGLLGAGRRTDMSPEAAVADALADIRLHELATMAAMQSAVRALVARLGPEPMRQAAEQGGLALPGARKARAWDAYEALHASVTRGLSDDFDSIFGKSFARAYEQAMQELAGRRKRSRDEDR